MVVDIRDIYENNLDLNLFGALLKIYCVKYNIDEDIVNLDYLTFNEEDTHNLEKKKLIKYINNEIHIRETGKLLIERLVTFSNSVNKKVVKTTDFDEFWSTYPSNDKHSIYYKTRALKSNKLGCRRKYNELIKEGVKHEDIIKALRFEVEERKDLSGRDNKLSFMKNSFTWLNQREFDIILENMNDNTTEGDWTSTTI